MDISYIRGSMKELVNRIADELDKSGGRHYVLMVEGDDGLHIAMYNNRESYHKMFVVLAEYIMNDVVPNVGYAEKGVLRQLLNDTIKMNKAEPKDETERALVNLKKQLTQSINEDL